MSLKLKVGGQVYEGWTKVRVTRGLERAAGDFDIELTERWPKQDSPWPILPGSACQVELDGQLAITGFVDGYDPAFDGQNHRVRATGRSKTMDAVDCSIVIKGGQLRGLTLQQIAETLCRQVKLGVVAEVSTGAAITDLQVNQGETIFEVIERLCRMRALLASDTPGGDLLLTRAGARRAAGSLEQGRNIVSAAAALRWNERFSHYVVKGQTAGTDELFGTAAAQISAEAVDRAMTRFRPKLIVAEGLADTAKAQQRATWEALRRAGRATSARITVKGWRQDNGRLWAPNELVPVRAPWLHLNDVLLIGEVTYQLDDRGRTTELYVSPAEAFTPEPSETKKAVSLWADVKSVKASRKASEIAEAG